MEYNIYFYVEDYGYMPTKNHVSDAGYDLCSTQNITLFPQCEEVIKTGVRIAKIETLSKRNIVGIIKSRSGLGINHGIECSNAGVIDNDYRGEIRIKLYNNSNSIYEIRKGDRVAQIVFLELPRINAFRVEDKNYIEKTERDEKGLGSSGR